MAGGAVGFCLGGTFPGSRKQVTPSVAACHRALGKMSDVVLAFVLRCCDGTLLEADKLSGASSRHTILELELLHAPEAVMPPRGSLAA